MSSISALGANQYSYSSPLQQLEAELQSEVSDGTISSSDQSALSSALTNINDSLTSGQSSPDGNGASGAGDIKSKINSLIQAQVSSGALTSNQATELQNLFANTFGDGHGGQGGPQGGPPPSGGGPNASPSTDSSSSSSSTDPGSSSNALQEFLKLLQDSQSYAYGANGTTAASSSSASTLINYQA